MWAPFGCLTLVDGLNYKYSNPLPFRSYLFKNSYAHQPQQITSWKQMWKKQTFCHFLDNFTKFTSMKKTVQFLCKSFNYHETYRAEASVAQVIVIINPRIQSITSYMDAFGRSRWYRLLLGLIFLIFLSLTTTCNLDVCDGDYPFPVLNKIRL